MEITDSRVATAKELKKLHDLYRSVFATENGALVLRDMMRDMFVLQIPQNEAQIALQAYATILLRKLGVIDIDGATQGVVDHLLAQDRL